MNLKELIKEVERLKKDIDINEFREVHIVSLQRIEQTVEAVDEIKHWNGSTICRLMDSDSLEDWQKLKELLNLK